ncbi:MAG: SPOR domain-containing protein [Magnetospirillum sp.]|nr:SPOR domain-containing protein [Magnetospirillum sp.]
MSLRPGDDFDRDILDIIPERFDADADSRHARAGHRLRTTVTLIVAAVAVGGLVAAGLRFVGTKPAAGPGIPVIKADDRPIRVRPDDRGGMEVPNQDKLVYDKMQGEGEPKTEQLLAPPEQPMLPPKANPAADAATPAPGAPAAAKPAESAAAAPPAAASQTAGNTAEESPGASYRPVQERPQSQAQPTKLAAAAAPVAPAAPAHDSRAAAVSAPPAPAAHKAAPPPAGEYVVQLGAVRSAEAADKEWARVSHAHAELLGGLKPDIIRVELGERGVFWRIRAGSLNEAAAHRLCQELAKRNQGCIVARK